MKVRPGLRSGGAFTVEVHTEPFITDFILALKKLKLHSSFNIPPHLAYSDDLESFGLKLFIATCPSFLRAILLVEQRLHIKGTVPEQTQLRISLEIFAS